MSILVRFLPGFLIIPKSCMAKIAPIAYKAEAPLKTPTALQHGYHNLINILLLEIIITYFAKKYIVFLSG